MPSICRAALSGQSPGQRPARDRRIRKIGGNPLELGIRPTLRREDARTLLAQTAGDCLTDPALPFVRAQFKEVDPSLWAPSLFGKAPS
jgi:hypothetical protein